MLGLLNWIGTVCGVTLMVLRIQPPVVMGWPYELGALLLIANFIPAMIWFASLFSPLPSTKYKYRSAFLFFYLLVQAYIFVVPVLKLYTYWSTNQSTRQYLGIHSAVVFVTMLMTVYFTCCITSWADRYRTAQFNQNQYARLSEEHEQLKYGSSKRTIQ